MIAVSIKTRPSIMPERMESPASGWRAMEETVFIITRPIASAPTAAATAMTMPADHAFALFSVVSAAAVLAAESAARPTH